MQRQHKYNTRKTYAVEDLREKLNRMRLEKGTNEEEQPKVPPPDPTYNYLRDPLRGDEFSNATKKQFPTKRRPMQSDNKPKRIENHNVPKIQERTHQENVKIEPNREKEAPKQPHKQEAKEKPTNKLPYNAKPHQNRRNTHFNSKEPSVNIKVEVSSESGERKCTLDESTTIQIPKVDHKPQYKKPKKFYNKQKMNTNNPREKNVENVEVIEKVKADESVPRDDKNEKE